MTKKIIISISVDEEVITKIDDMRGLAARSAVINMILENAVKDDEE